MSDVMKNKAYYLNLRKKFTTKTVKIIFVLESPPKSGLYFYDQRDRTSEPLFKAVMKVLNIDHENKAEGLEKFKSKGCLLMDATYTPVNNLRGVKKDKAILEDYNSLVSDLRNNTRKNTKIILVKVNICDLLEYRLRNEGFNIINRGVRVPFPNHVHQGRFHQEINIIFKNEG